MTVKEDMSLVKRAVYVAQYESGSSKSYNKLEDEALSRLEQLAGLGQIAVDAWTSKAEWSEIVFDAIQEHIKKNDILI